MIYGYTRVSTELQNTENQKHEIQTFAEANKITINKWVKGNFFKKIIKRKTTW